MVRRALALNPKQARVRSKLQPVAVTAPEAGTGAEPEGGAGAAHSKAPEADWGQPLQAWYNNAVRAVAEVEDVMLLDWDTAMRAIHVPGSMNAGWDDPVSHLRARCLRDQTHPVENATEVMGFVIERFAVLWERLGAPPADQGLPSPRVCAQLNADGSIREEAVRQQPPVGHTLLADRSGSVTEYCRCGVSSTASGPGSLHNVSQLSLRSSAMHDYFPFSCGTACACIAPPTVKVADHRRCGELPWLGVVASANACRVQVLCQSATACSHTHFNFANDKNCVCAPPPRLSLRRHPSQAAFIDLQDYPSVTLTRGKRGHRVVHTAGWVVVGRVYNHKITTASQDYKPQNKTGANGVHDELTVPRPRGYSNRQ